MEHYIPPDIHVAAGPFQHPTFSQEGSVPLAPPAPQSGSQDSTSLVPPAPHTPQSAPPAPQLAPQTDRSSHSHISDVMIMVKTIDHIYICEFMMAIGLVLISVGYWL
ncbi:hypothetical protein Dimus_024802 [Dionaea muscipula]